MGSDEVRDVDIRDVDYEHDGTRLRGAIVAPAGARAGKTVVLIHDAFGLGDEAFGIAGRLAEAGYTVFAADVWGERLTPASQAEIGPLMGALIGDRERWNGRVSAAHAIAATAPEVDPDQIVLLGYCFGGSGALEYLRRGGRVRGVVAVHPGLDIVEFDWSGAAGSDAAVLISVGAADPMATPEQIAAAQAGMTSAGIDWETDTFSGTVHAFTSPKAAFSPNPAVVAYHPRNAARAWDRTLRFLAELFSA